MSRKTHVEIRMENWKTVDMVWGRRQEKRGRNRNMRIIRRGEIRTNKQE